MIVSRTPFRISFFGGGTDYPSWFEKNNGTVISTTIDKYLYLTIRFLPPFFSHRHRIVWSKVELVDRISEIKHPLIREGLNLMGFSDNGIGFDIHYQSDLPARSGMGSSSAFSVGLLKSLYEISNKKITKKTLSYEAIKLERDILKEYVGSQDQSAVAHGGLNKIDFKKNHKINVRKINIKKHSVKELESNVMLFYTGISRSASKIAESIVKRTDKNQHMLKKMQIITDQAYNILISEKSLDNIGDLLDESWKLKRKLSDSVSNARIDNIYKIAKQNGALGGKILGAGGAGFMIFFVNRKNQLRVRNALKKLLWVPFKFTNSGSSIIYRDYKDRFMANPK